MVKLIEKYDQLLEMLELSKTKLVVVDFLPSGESGLLFRSVMVAMVPCPTPVNIRKLTLACWHVALVRCSLAKW
jgi:hypothetical protein